MTTLSIKDVPDDWADVLRQRAARNHRSLQGELSAILEAAVLSDASAPGSAAVAPSIGGSARPGRLPVRSGGKTIEQIAMEHRQRFPQPIRTGPLAVDIIRKDRDAR